VGLWDILAESSSRRKGMTKDDLATFVSQETDLSKKVAGETIRAVFQGISSALDEGGSVSIMGFGTFKVVERAAREGRNPKTGEKIQIQPYKAVKFTPGQSLKQRVR
jgi:DNA-binding protein HU-beta